jgi:hypothetical protein
MSFTEAVALIAKREDVWLCDDQEEHTGLHPSICVYADDVDGWFLGKLRWPRDGKPARVDHEVADFLRGGG